MTSPPELFGSVSYAHDDERLVNEFLRLMKPRCASLRQCTLNSWTDRTILLGQDWRDEIDLAIGNSDFGILLISPSFLASPFITEVELPALLARTEALVLPIGLEAVSFGKADLKGLESLQTFLLHRRGQVERRWFSETGGNNRKRFCDHLIEQLMSRFEEAGLVDG